jgi:gamma-glutamylcyclotransferase (GGCT)/AIG2-like uncharacterized protein YtfP
MNLEPLEAGECILLFVYGTLRRGFERHHHLERLGAKFRGKAQVAADLLDLGRYPGARPARGAGKWVHGEVFKLPRPEHDLRVLDRIENFLSEDPARSEFLRATTAVNLQNGERRVAWIYWLSPGARAGRRRIASGDYAAWRAER